MTDLLSKMRNAASIDNSILRICTRTFLLSPRMHRLELFVAIRPCLSKTRRTEASIKIVKSERRGERAHDGHSRIHSRERSTHGRLAPNADEKDAKRMRMRREGEGEK